MGHGQKAAAAGGVPLSPDQLLLLPPEGWAPRFDAEDADRVWRGGHRPWAPT